MSKPGRDYLRIDPAHPAAGAGQSVPVPETAAVIAAPADAAEQLQLQIGQLAMQMRERQGNLDHRESHLNARIAQVDQEIRSIRLWMEEQQALWEQRQERLAAKEAELQNRLDRLAAVDASLQQKAEELAEIEESLFQARSVSEG